MNYAEVIEFVKKQTSKEDRPDIEPFRSRFEHTMRVYRWAIKLQAKVGGDLELITLAALLHDVGWEDGRPSNEVSCEVAVEYLDSIEYDEERIGRVGELIMLQNQQEAMDDIQGNLSIECKVVMDAILLDEIGAISVLWDAMAVAVSDEATYKKAYYRIKNFYRINRAKIRHLKTDVAKKEFEHRLKTIEDFLAELERELF